MVLIFKGQKIQLFSCGKPLRIQYLILILTCEKEVDCKICLLKVYQSLATMWYIKLFLFTFLATQWKSFLCPFLVLFPLTHFQKYIYFFPSAFHFPAAPNPTSWTFNSWLGSQSAEDSGGEQHLPLFPDLPFVLHWLTHTAFGLLQKARKQCYATFFLWDAIPSASVLVSVCCDLVLDPCLIHQILYIFIFKDFSSTA